MLWSVNDNTESVKIRGKIVSNGILFVSRIVKWHQCAIITTRRKKLHNGNFRQFFSCLFHSLNRWTKVSFNYNFFFLPTTKNAWKYHRSFHTTSSTLKIASSQNLSKFTAHWKLCQKISKQPLLLSPFRAFFRLFIPILPSKHRRTAK